MGERGPEGPTDATLIKVWELRAQGRGYARISEELGGIPVRTLKRYHATARELLGTIGWLDRRARILVEREVDVAAEREHSVAVIEAVQGAMHDAIANGLALPVDAAKVIIDAERLRAELLGTKATVRAQLDINALNAANAVQPDENVREAVWRARNAQRRAAGQPELPPPDEDDPDVVEGESYDPDDAPGGDR